jgi:hypothetical protein
VTRFSVSRVREPGTAERESLRLRPQGDRRMPGTRPSCPWRQALPLRPPLRPSSFSVSRVREPGTAEGDSVCLRPDGGRRMPGTRPPCLRRQASPVREVTCSAEPVNLVLRGARKGAQRWDVPGLTMCEDRSQFEVHIVEPGITPMGAARGPCHGDRRPLGRRGRVAGLGPPAQLGGTLWPSDHTESSGSA